MRGSRRIYILIILGMVLFLPLHLGFASKLTYSHTELTWVDDSLPAISISSAEVCNTTLSTEECSSVIVTGTAAKDGRAILMKNRDWALDRSNRPIYTPATDSHFAYVGVNSNTMGINEKGLAVMNTAMPVLETEPGIGNLNLNQKLLEEYESVAEIAAALNDSRSFIGPNYRSSLGTIATCVGVIDRFGEGAFFEISNTEAYVQYIVDGYDSRANHPRIFPGYASGPSGRDQYLLDTLDTVYAKNGVISWEDIMQNASRYVRDKELGTSSFSIDGEVCNTATVAAMVAVSGDDRYDGKLNIMWGAYGLTPLVGVFVPSMVVAGETPDSVANLWSYTSQKYMSAQVQEDPLLLAPSRVREIQNYSFFAEEFTMNEYENLLSFVPPGLTDYQICSTVREFILRLDDYAAEVFREETFDVEVPPSIYFPTPSPPPSTTSSTPTSPTDTSTTPIVSIATDSSSGTNTSITFYSNLNVIATLFLGFGMGGAISVVLALILLKKHQ